VLRWFSSHTWPQADGTKKRSGASAAFVVDLNGEPFLLIPFWEGKADWHEQALNSVCIGVETVNAGELRRQPDGSWTTWPNRWTKPYGLAASLPPQPVLDWRGARYMQPFTREQLITNLVIKRGLIAMYPGKIRPDLVLEHSTVREDKFDMGPLWPLAKLREAAFSQAPLNSFGFLGNHAHVEGEDYDAIDATDLVAINATSVDSLLPAQHEESPIEKAGILWVQLSLNQLGYAVMATGMPTVEYAAAVKKFQTDQGLTVDGIAGRMTRKLIATMLAARK
jgi:N-acetyl-anhydromuramyl-L-alanine amidase AmpD